MDPKKQDAELQQKCSHQLAMLGPDKVVDRFKCCAFLHSGCRGIKSIGRKFRIMDDSGDRRLSVEEFVKGCLEMRIRMSPDQLLQVFSQFDTDGSGTLDFNEFLRAVRPPVSPVRKTLINRAFAKMDQTGDGVITVRDLVGVYDCSKHPKYKSGQMTEKQVYQEFLDSFAMGENDDGLITREEWLNYYSGISASIDDDAYFRLMMMEAWKLN